MATKTTTNGTNEATSAAAKAASNDYDALKHDIAQLRDDLQSLANNSGQYLKGRSSAEFDKNLERGREYATKAGERASSAKDYVETKVRQNPLASVGIAFGTGVLLAALRRK
ncbi:DUF883 family protein [Henriciella aquimarina]|uniref:DUF883 family protein n=1 Tax=Henriciella aquimarina TaxID=545261 RepID=UPI001301D3C3|nr:DUF883 family protein [Henriciella aquimarina]